MTAGRYRKKPVEIEAARIVVSLAVVDGSDEFDKNAESIAAISSWMLRNGCKHFRVHGERAPFGIAIPTLEGVMIADPGDWIIRGVKGEFYPIKDAIFRETYEPVSS